MSEREGIKLPLGRYAELMAHLAYFAGVDPHELRELLSIAPEAFADANARWPLRLRADQLEGDGALTARFGASFAAASNTLRDGACTLEQLRSRRPGAAQRSSTGSLDETSLGAVDLGGKFFAGRGVDLLTDGRGVGDGH